MLKVITFTGADDSIDPVKLGVYASKHAPSIEFAILFSKDQGRERYPSREWIKEFAAVAKRTGLKCAAHLCGDYVKDMGTIKPLEEFGRNLWLRDYPEEAAVFENVQINSGHAIPKNAAELEYIRALRALNPRNIIVQTDGNKVNHLNFLQINGFDVSSLVDSSGGRGVEATFHKPSFEAEIMGFAGGINPDNIVEKLINIYEVFKGDFWVDMESGIRSEVNGKSVFDLKKVDSVIAQCQAFIKDLIVP